MYSIKQTLATALTLLACHFPVIALAAGVPDFPAPPKANVVLVSKNTKIAGRDMQIRQFHSKKEPDRVKEFYYELWETTEDGEKPGYIESDVFPPWDIITRVENDYLMTVQLQEADNGDTWGYLAISKVDPDAKGKKSTTTLPSPPGTEIMQQTKSDDEGKKGETLILANQSSLSSNVNYYRNYYEDRGWRQDMDRAVPQQRSHVMAFTNGRKKINIVLFGGDNETRIVVNHITSDIL